MNPDLTEDALALEILFRIAPGHRTEFLQTVELLMSGSDAAPGLEELSCFERVDVANSFLWRECWRSRGQLESRLRSRTLETLLGAIGVLGELQSFGVLAAVVSHLHANDGPCRPWGRAGSSKSRTEFSS